MSELTEITNFIQLTEKHNYSIDSLKTEIRADRCCSQLLKFFHKWLREEQQLEELEAGRCAAGADYFLREFIVGAKRLNIFEIQPQQLKEFGGNWYIISNLEPNIPELKPMLKGTGLFYQYAVQHRLFDRHRADEISRLSADEAFFQQRLDDFFALTDNGYQNWNQACPFK